MLLSCPPQLIKFNFNYQKQSKEQKFGVKRNRHLQALINGEKRNIVKFE